MADMAHYSGLVAAGEYPSPLPHAHVVTSTTHKTLRGPRGGIILSNDEELGKKLNSAVFPGLQGGPLQHVIAAKSIAFKEALQPEFKEYQRDVKNNAKILCNVLRQRGLNIVSGGTDSHMLLVDLRPFNISGKDAANVLERSGIICNKNTIPSDTSPFNPSGIRLGTAAGTTKGLNNLDFHHVGDYICNVLENYHKDVEGNKIIENETKILVTNMMSIKSKYK
jgi:glycine hydroxymethyltransferase